MGALNKPGGYSWVYLATNAFSAYTILRAAKTKKSSEIQNFLHNSIICPLGCFKQIVTDGELSLENSTNFQEFLDQFGITRTITGVNSHFTLGLIERVVSKAKQAIRNITFQTQIEWHKIIGIVNCSLNKTVLSYNVSAEKVLFGQDLENIFTPLQFQLATTDPSQYYENIKQIIREAQSTLRRNKERKARDNLAYINRKTKEKHFKENQIATYSNLKTEAGRGLTIKNVPCQIISVTKSTAYVKDLISGKFSKQHFSHIHDFVHNEEIELPSNWHEMILEYPIQQNQQQEQFEGYQQRPNSTMLSIDHELPNRQVDTSPITNQPQTWDTTENFSEHPQHPQTSSEATATTTHTSQLKDTLQRLLTHIQNKSHPTSTHDNNSQDDVQDS